ncbi:MAG: hypothetical protein GY940_35500 [bacterium]|nr:hypothetical protein [bacterium]
MADLLVAGFKEFKSHFKEKKVVNYHLRKVEKLSGKAMELKTKQHRLQGELKATTAELRDTLKALGKEVGHGRSTVKHYIEQTLWKAFGIDNKR